jgi:hypothetical protein
VRRGQREGRLDRDRSKDDRARDGEDGTTDAATDAATAEPEVTADPTPASAADDGDGLPVWVAPVALLVLAAAAGVTAVVRRRSAR